MSVSIEIQILSFVLLWWCIKSTECLYGGVHMWVWVHVCVVIMWTTGVGTQVLPTVCLKVCSIGQASWISSYERFAYLHLSSYHHWDHRHILLWLAFYVGSGDQNEIITFVRQVLYQLSCLPAYCCFLFVSFTLHSCINPILSWQLASILRIFLWYS